MHFPIGSNGSQSHLPRQGVELRSLAGLRQARSVFTPAYSRWDSHVAPDPPSGVIENYNVRQAFVEYFVLALQIYILYLTAEYVLGQRSNYKKTDS